MNADQILKILKTINSAYSRFDVTDDRIALWGDMLKDMDFNKVMHRLKTHIKDKPFPPSISEISVYETPKNEFLEKYRRWQLEGAERIAKQRRDERGQSEQQPRSDK